MVECVPCCVGSIRRGGPRVSGDVSGGGRVGGRHGVMAYTDALGCGRLRLSGSVIVALPQWSGMTQAQAGSGQANRQAAECTRCR